jgi:hypothetical protein
VSVGDAQAVVLASVSPRALHAYLGAQGWRKVKPLGDRGDLYSREGAPDIAAPASDHLADYVLAMGQIVDILARVEGRDPAAVLRDLTVADVDLVRVRAPHAEEDGSISIDDGVELVQQSRDLLLAAACSVTRPQRAYRAGGIREATEYLEQVRFGQTERGSFVVTMLSPVPPALGPAAQPGLWEDFEEQPFARKVTRRLVEALDAAVEAVALANRGEGIAAFEARVMNGVSANLCAAAARLAERGHGLEVSVSWALTRLTPTRRRRVELTRADAGILDEAARVLRDREPRPGERLEGYVTHLARGPEAEQGQVTIRAVVDGRMSSVRVDFGPDLYRRVVEAHVHRRSVTLEGDLEREGQRWRLVRPRDLVVLPTEDQEGAP